MHAKRCQRLKKIEFRKNCYVPFEDILKPYILDSLNFLLLNDKKSENLKVIPTSLTV